MLRRRRLLLRDRRVLRSRNVDSSRPWRTLSVFLAAAAAACGQGSPNGGGHAFDEAFVITSKIELEEDANSPLGTIGAFAIGSEGHLLVADGMAPRVVRYDGRGRRLAEAGTEGSGPGEFRRIAAVAEAPGGAVVVVDDLLGRITVLDEGLRATRTFSPASRPSAPLVRMGDGFVLGTRTDPRSGAFAFMDEQWDSRWSVALGTAEEVTEHPYWASYARRLATATPEWLAAAHSFLYPIYLYDRQGAIMDSIAEPPSFRRAPVLERGALAGEGAQLQRERWFNELDVIARLDALDEAFLVVTHGRLRAVEGASLPRTEHRWIDVYLVPTGRKLLREVLIPDGMKLLGSGGDSLYFLEGGPPDDWTIVQARLALNL